MDNLTQTKSKKTTPKKTTSKTATKSKKTTSKTVSDSKKTTSKSESKKAKNIAIIHNNAVEPAVNAVDSVNKINTDSVNTIDTDKANTIDTDSTNKIDTDSDKEIDKQTENEIIKKLLKIEKAIENYKLKNRLSYYNATPPIHQKQMQFHQCLKRNRWVFGGNRSGKSECGAVETVWLARGIHPYRQNRNNVFGWVVSPTLALSRDVAQNKVLSYLNPDWIADIVMQSGSASNPSSGVIDFILVKNVFGGTSKIGFKSAQMGREKFQGASLDFVWFDEEPPESIYDECRMRLIDKKGEIFGTMTPLKGLTYLYRRVYLNENDDGEVWHTFMEWGDNPYLDKDEVNLMSASMSKEQLERRRYGKFSSASGLVYSEFDQNVHVIEPFDVPKEWFDKLSIDPGLNNPLSCHWYAIDYDNNIYVVAEHYERGKTVDHHAKKIWEISQRLGWHTDSFGRLNALIDSAASQRTLASSKSVVELFLEHGIQVNPHVNKEMFAGISRVKQYLNGTGGRLYIFRSCVNMIREFKGYWWGEDDVPKKYDDHALDELRYYIMSRPEANKGLKTQSEITKDKKALIKRLKNRI